MNKPEDLKPLCSVCMQELRDSGCRIIAYKSRSWLYTGKCWWCGKEVAVRDVRVRWRTRKTTGGA